MTFRRPVLIGLGIVLAAGLATLLVWQPPQPLKGGPVYANRTAEAWLADIFPARPEGRSQSAAIDAFRHMGQDGVVFLVDSLDWKRQSGWGHRTLFRLLPYRWRDTFPEPMIADTMANAASLVLSNVEDTDPETTARRLVDYLSARNPRTRVFASRFLSHYALNYKWVDFSKFVPAFSAALNDSEAMVRIHVVAASMDAGLDIPGRLEALAPSLSAANKHERQAAEALSKRLLENGVQSAVAPK